MPDIIVTSDLQPEGLLIATEREQYRSCFRVLDPRQIMVVDIDLSDTFVEAAALALLNDFCDDNEFLFRVYRTKRGLRYIEVSALWIPRTPFVVDVMAAVSADPAYVAANVLASRPGLEAGTFAARLDPKPWYMTDGPTKEALVAMSDADYAAYKTTWETAKLGYRAAQYLYDEGDGGLAVHPWAQLVIDYHEAQCRISSTSLPLA